MAEETTNGGYGKDKSGIEARLEQNAKDHERMEEQNNNDHQDIKKLLGKNEDCLAKIKETYLADVIELKTKVSGLIKAVLILTPIVLGLLAKAVVAWIEKN